MALKLPRLFPNFQSQPQLFERYWDDAMKRIEQAFIDIQQQIDDLAVLVKRDRRNSSYTVPTQILNAVDAGTDVTITINDHVRVYGDGTELPITGGVFAGYDYATTYVVYYIDVAQTDTTPAFVITEDLEAGAAGAADGLHSLGVFTTPSSGGNPVLGGGSYAPGFTVGGVIE